MSPRMLFKKIGFSLFIRIAGTGLAFLLSLLLARTMSVSDFGVYSYYMALILTLAPIVHFGFPQVAIRFIPHEELEIQNHNAARFWFATFKTLLVVFAGAAFVIAVLYNIEQSLIELNWILIVCGVCIFLTALMQLNTQTLRSLKKFKLAQLSEQILLPMGQLFIVLTLVAFGVGLSALEPLYGLIVALLVTSFLGMIAIFSAVQKTSYVGNNDVQYLKYVTASVPLAIVTFSTALASRLEIFVLEYLDQIQMVALIAIAIKIAKLQLFAQFASNFVNGPYIKELYESGQSNKLQKQIRLSVILSSSFGAMFFLVIFFFAQEILNLFGSEYVEAHLALVIITFGEFVNVCSGPIMPVFSALGKHKLYMLIKLTGLALKLVLSLVLIYNYMLLGAALAACITAIFENMVLAVIIKRTFGFDTPIYAPKNIQYLFQKMKSCIN